MLSHTCTYHVLRLLRPSSTTKSLLLHVQRFRGSCTWIGSILHDIPHMLSHLCALALTHSFTTMLLHSHSPCSSLIICLSNTIYIASTTNGTSDVSDTTHISDTIHVFSTSCISSNTHIPSTVNMFSTAGVSDTAGISGTTCISNTVLLSKTQGSHVAKLSPPNILFLWIQSDFTSMQTCKWECVKNKQRQLY